MSDWATLILGYSGAIVGIGGYALWLLRRSAKVGRHLRLGDLGDLGDAGPDGLGHP